MICGGMSKIKFNFLLGMKKKILKVQQHKQRALDQLYEVKKDNIILHSNN